MFGEPSRSKRVHAAVVYEAFPGFRGEETMDIIIVTRNPLASAA
jgi:hypothetical protein